MGGFAVCFDDRAIFRQTLSAAKRERAGVDVSEASRTGARAPARVLQVLRTGLAPLASERYVSMDALINALLAAARPSRKLTAAVAAFAAAVVVGAALLQMWMFADWRRNVHDAREAARADAGPR